MRALTSKCHLGYSDSAGRLSDSTKSDFETGKGCVFNEQNLPMSKTHSLVIKPQEVNFK